MAKKKKKLQDEKTISLTQTGVICNPGLNDLTILDTLMRKFESAKRFSRERIFEGLDRKETVELSVWNILNLQCMHHSDIGKYTDSSVRFNCKYKFIL